jgi:hypothetical protein
MKKFTALFAAMLAIGIFISVTGFVSSDTAYSETQASQQATGAYTWSLKLKQPGQRINQFSPVVRMAQQCAKRGDLCNYEACPGGEGGCKSNCCAGLICKLYPAQAGATGSSGCE